MEIMNNRDEIIKKGDEYLSKMDYNECEQIYLSVYQDQDEQINYKLGKLYNLMGETEKAKEYLLRSIKANVNGKYYKKYFEYGQLVSPLTGVESYNKGIELLEDMISNNTDILLHSKLEKDLLTAYCSLAEIYQTDLLQFKESEKECIDNIKKALKIDPNSLDALYQHALYFFNKEDHQTATSILNQLHQIFLQTEDYSDYDLYTNIAKLFMELQMYEMAIDVLQVVENSDQTQLEPIYLQAFSYFKLANYQAVQEILNDIQNNIQLQNSIKCDQELYEAFIDLQKELSKVDVSNVKSNQMQEEDEEEQWEEEI